ncbi:MAG: LPS export ABC transporter permease LptF [Thiotrichales bacterium]
MKIITRAVIAETTGNLFAVLTVLLLILLGGLFVRLLGKVADGTLDSAILFPLLSLASLHSATSLLAVSFFLAVLLTLGRMYKDSEIHALRAGGYGELQLLKPVLVVGTTMALVLGVLSFWISPWANAHARQLRQEAVQAIDLGGVTPGRFVSFPSQQRVVYAEALDSNSRELRNIYIFQEYGDALRIIAADRARQTTVSDTDDKFLELLEGEMLQIAEGPEARISRIGFSENGIRLPATAAAIQAGVVNQLSVLELWRGDDARLKAEFQWRLSFPLSVLVLSIVAIPMSHTQPRKGRFGKLALAVLVYLLYANMLGLARKWIESGQISPSLGLWWIHFAFLALGVLLLLYQVGYWPVRRQRAVGES